MVHNDYEEKLRKDFLKALQDNNGGNVVDDLISVLKEDYILIVKEELYCRDCLHYQDTIGWIRPDYCMYYQNMIHNLSKANNCDHYCSGHHETRKSIARLHNTLTGDLFYE